MKKAAAISLVIITITLCISFLMHQARTGAFATAQDALNLVRQALNITPEVTVSTYVSYQKTSDILELASVSKSFPIEYVYESTFLHSTKRLVLNGEYTVKAGFDLRERFNIRVDQWTHKVHADFPAPKILSVQQNSYKVAEDEDGYWNGLTQEDQQTAVNAMNAKAREAALAMNVIADARESLRKQLLDLAAKSGQDWVITFRDEPVNPSSPQTDISLTPHE
jgi:hypothetical protein